MNQLITRFWEAPTSTGNEPDCTQLRLHSEPSCNRCTSHHMASDWQDMFLAREKHSASSPSSSHLRFSSPSSGVPMARHSSMWPWNSRRTWPPVRNPGRRNMPHSEYVNVSLWYVCTMGILNHNNKTCRSSSYINEYVWVYTICEGCTLLLAGEQKVWSRCVPSASSHPEVNGVMFHRVCMKEASTIRSPLA